MPGVIILMVLLHSIHFCIRFLLILSILIDVLQVKQYYFVVILLMMLFSNLFALHRSRAEVMKKIIVSTSFMHSSSTQLLLFFLSVNLSLLIKVVRNCFLLACVIVAQTQLKINYIVIIFKFHLLIQFSSIVLTAYVEIV